MQSLEELYNKDLLYYKTNPKALPKYQDGIGIFKGWIENDISKYIKKFNTAIDIGARVGEWTRPLSSKFNNVISFEAREKWCTCFLKNIKMDNVKLYNYALGNTNSWAKMSGNRIKGDSEEYKKLIHKTSTQPVEIRPLDSFNIDDVDFIKIDTDGYEMEVLLGGESTILKTKPIIFIECEVKTKDDKLPDYCKYLEGIGAKVLKEYGNHTHYIHDRLYGWE